MEQQAAFDFAGADMMFEEAARAQRAQVRGQLWRAVEALAPERRTALLLAAATKLGCSRSEVQLLALVDDATRDDPRAPVPISHASAAAALNVSVATVRRLVASRCHGLLGCLPAKDAGGNHVGPNAYAIDWPLVLLGVGDVPPATQEEAASRPAAPALKSEHPVRKIAQGVRTIAQGVRKREHPPSAARALSPARDARAPRACARADSDLTLTMTTTTREKLRGVDTRTAAAAAARVLRQLFRGEPPCLEPDERRLVVSVCLVAEAGGWIHLVEEAARRTAREARRRASGARQIDSPLAYWHRIVGNDLCERLRIAPTRRAGRELLRELLEMAGDVAAEIERATRPRWSPTAKPPPVRPLLQADPDELAEGREAVRAALAMLRRGEGDESGIGCAALGEAWAAARLEAAADRGSEESRPEEAKR